MASYREMPSRSPDIRGRIRARIQQETPQMCGQWKRRKGGEAKAETADTHRPVERYPLLVYDGHLLKKGADDGDAEPLHHEVHFD